MTNDRSAAILRYLLLVTTLLTIFPMLVGANARLYRTDIRPDEVLFPNSSSISSSTPSENEASVDTKAKVEQKDTTNISKTYVPDSIYFRLKPFKNKSGDKAEQKKKIGPFNISFGGSKVKLNYVWRFAYGDSSQWAKPNYSDSHWESLKAYYVRKEKREIEPEYKEASHTIDSLRKAGIIKSKDKSEDEDEAEDELENIKDPYKSYFRLDEDVFADLLKKKRNMWFRIKLKIDSTLLGKPLAIIMDQQGACDIYIDGALFKSYGIVSDSKEKEERYHTHNQPVTYTFNRDTIHTIAVRFSDHSDNPEGFEMYIDDIDDAISSVQLITKIAMGFPTVMFGFFFALCIVHLLIYLFERKKSFNLFYGIFIGSVAFSLLLPTVYYNITDMVIIEKIEYWSSMIVPIYLICFIAILYALFNNLKHKLFLIEAALAAIDVCLYAFRSPYSGAISGLIGLIAYIDSFRLSIKGIRQNKEGAKFVGFGVLGSTIFLIISFFWITFGAIFIGSSESESGITFLIVGFLVLVAAAIFSMPFSVSVYLAYNFASTNRRLEKQFSEIHALSELNLKQEQEKKAILEGQNEALEQQVAERTKEIMLQNEVILRQSREVSDSIHYASRIQQAMIPSIEKLSAVFPDSAYIFRPKAVVSGDFLFYSEAEGLYVFAVVDCTGHGVPGAMMSMIGSMLLHQIVTEANTSQPNLILEELNQRLIMILRQNETTSETRDGMDIALCVYHPEEQWIEYAGAMRPLYIIRDSKNEQPSIEEIKANKRSIGGLMYEMKSSFYTHRIQLATGDRIFMFSDGFADQFGGPKGKKFMLRNFKALLEHSSRLSLRQQINALNQSFDDWKGENEQVDDVLVLGLEIPEKANHKKD
jgi:serine phosphatase RsbU (regulator of sigma subunit)